MYFRRCNISLTNLKRILTVTIALTVGVMVGLAPRTFKSKTTHLKSAKTLTMEPLTTATIPTTTIRETTVEDLNVVNKSYYIQIAKNIPVTSWRRGATDEDETSYAFNCKIRVPTVHFGVGGQFKQLPLSFLRYNTKPQALPKCGQDTLLFPWSQIHQRAWMIFIVKTAPNNFERRRQIRESWGSIEILREKHLIVMFVIGTASGVMEEQALAEENQIYGDILQCEFEDNYRNLPIKVLSAMRYLLEGHIDSQFYTITDDDCVMNPMNIVTFFSHAADRDVMYCGFLYDRNAKSMRKRDSKWKIDLETYDQTYYPTFCHGGMWTVTKHFMRDLYCMAEMTNRSTFHLEDVYITGILREKLGHQRRDIQPVLTQSGNKYELMFYPWDETERGTLKMQSRWLRMNRTLPWGHQRTRNSHTLVIRPIRTDTLKIAQLEAKWSAISAKRKNITSPTILM